jgi:hypothetical protein
VPGGRRCDWLEEWEGEFWQLRRRRPGAVRTTIFLAGAVWHGLFEWKEGWTMESMGQDIRYAWRTLARSPGFALSAVLMLAASIGASTALFSVLEAAVLADPPFPEPDRLVVVDQMFGTEAGDQWNTAAWGYPRYADLTEDVGSLEQAAGYSLRTMTLSELGDPSLVSVETITPSLMPLLGIEAITGRTFGAQEEDQGAPSLSALVSNGFWHARLGADPGAVGSVITLDGARLEVLGVLPAGFRGITGRAEVWIPMSALRVIEDPSFLEDPWNLHFNVVARLAPDATLASLQPELDAFAEALGGATHRPWRPPGSRSTSRRSPFARHVPTPKPRDPFWRCSARCCWFCLWRRRTWRGSCSRGAPIVDGRPRSARRWAQGEVGCCGNSSPKAWCCRCWAGLSG